MRRWTIGICFEKCFVRRVHRCANVIECTHTNLESTALWYSLLLLGYKPVQHVIVLNTVGSCNTMLSTVILYYNLIEPPSFMRPVVDQNFVMRRMPVQLQVLQYRATVRPFDCNQQPGEVCAASRNHSVCTLSHIM